jgi:site-specific recombinase XerD/ribosomal protein L40E
MTYAEAATKRSAKLIDAIALDPNIPKSNKKLAAEYADFMRARGLTERSVSKNLYCLSTFFKFAGKKDILKLTKEEVTRAVAGIEGSGYSTKTKQGILIAIKSLYKHFLGNDDLYPDQVRWIKTTMKGSKRVLPEDILVEQDILKMIKASNSVRDKAIIALLFDSGVRIGELLNMKARDVNLKTEPVHVTVDGKTGMRQIPITFSAKYLALYLDMQTERKPGDYLWNMKGSWSNSNAPLDRAGVAKMLNLVAKKAGIEKRVNPHSFRHARATHYANKLTEQQLKVFFGWTGSSNMASTYVHLSGRDIDNAILQANGMKPVEVNEESKLIEKTCPRCQNTNTVSSTYCSRCGSALDISIAIRDEERRKTVEEAAVAEMEKKFQKNELAKKIKGKRASTSQVNKP